MPHASKYLSCVAEVFWYFQFQANAFLRSILKFRVIDKAFSASLIQDVILDARQSLNFHERIVFPDGLQGYVVGTICEVQLEHPSLSEIELMSYQVVRWLSNCDFESLFAHRIIAALLNIHKQFPK